MDGAWWLVVALVGGLVLTAAGLAWRPCRAAWRESNLARARREFHRRREHLEARFYTLAAKSGRPRGLEWTNCEFDDAVVYARDRRSGQLSAFVAVAIHFEAIEGGGMEHVEAVGNVRAATAVFRIDRGKWSTEGRAIFNLNPAEAIQYFQANLEMVGQEPV